MFNANIDISPEEYGAIVFVLPIIYFFFFILITLLLLSRFITTSTLFFGLVIPDFIFVSIIISIVFSILIFTQLLAYPKIRVKKRVRDIDSHLIFALRTLLIQIKSGVSLFDSMAMVAFSKRFGELGEELKTAVDKINTGYFEEVALEEMARKNPSPNLRKVIWQILNGMKAGSDTSTILEETVNTIVREQQIELKKYDSSLRMLSLMYLMIGVIIPALGITFIIVVGSFPRIEITEIVFWGFLGGIVLMEFVFIGIIKSKRPALMGD